MYARYRTRSKFYKRPERLLKAYGVSPSLLRRPQVKQGLLSGIYKDEDIDLRDKERLELVETIRHPKERDFYQDHTYHNQWELRDLEPHQKKQLSAHYRYFAPFFTTESAGTKLFAGSDNMERHAAEAEPWVFYPGDTVEVVKGEGQGQRGTIIAVVRYKNEVVVQNVNVQDVVIPASETRPEQKVQREHPIAADRVCHVDPSTNELCHLDIITVRNKTTGELEQKRISLESGVLLPLPARDDGAVEAGDPLKDTPITDADEATYDPEKEIPLLREKKLQEMENYFVLHSLRRSHEFHAALGEKNAQQMESFQMAVVDGAAEKLAAQVAARMAATPEATLVNRQGTGSTPPPSPSGAVDTSGAVAAPLPVWWAAMVSARAAVLREEDAAREAEAAELARQQAADGRASNRLVGDVDGMDDDFADVAAEDDDEVGDNDREERGLHRFE